jgi:proline iminopeptidase
MTVLRSPYPPLQPFRTGRLRVSDLHELYFEECGNPQGKPVVILHGGPGGGLSPQMRSLHDPQAYRIVLFDQRGCGQSTPRGELRDNTTWDLVADMERLREHLGIERWQVLGGSWGSTLAIAYAETHPGRVSELVLRGIFLARKSEIAWFYQEGCGWIFPDAYEKLVAPIPAEERHDLLAAFHRRLTGNDAKAKLAVAKAWSQWEGTTISLLPNPERVESFGRDEFAEVFAAIECHYFMHDAYLTPDTQLLDNAHLLHGIPGIIVHGRYDVVTPLANAWALHKAWPEARLEIVADAGHTMTEPGITSALVRATDFFRDAKTA